MPKIEELHEQKRKHIHDARSILDTAEKEERDATTEEDERFNKLMNKADELQKQIGRQQRAEAAERELNKVGERRTRPGDADDDEEGEDRKVGPRSTSEYRKAFNGYLVNGREGISESEYRALQSDDDASGGYLVAPEQFINELIKELDDTLWIRQLSRVFPPTEAQSLGAPKRTAKMNTFNWSAELQTSTADTALKFGKRSLYPHHLTGEIKVSRDLLRSNVLDAEQIVREEMARDRGETEEQAFMTGSGAEQPLGIFTASASGISTARDVSTDNTTTAPTLDGLTNAKYSLKQQHLNNANWVFHRDVVKVIAKIKDGEGNYIWRENVRVGEPDILLGRPVRMSEFAPNTLTTGLYVGILGDFRRYWIAESSIAEVQRLVELYAATGEIGFIGRYKVDGMPVLEEAFARVKLL